MQCVRSTIHFIYICIIHWLFFTSGFTAVRWFVHTVTWVPFRPGFSLRTSAGCEASAHCFKKHLRADVFGLTCPFSRLLTAGCFHTYFLLTRNLPGDGVIAACVGKVQSSQQCCKADSTHLCHSSKIYYTVSNFAASSWKKMNSNAKMGSRIYLSPPKVVWTWHRSLVYGARGRNCLASMRSSLETCRMFSTRLGTWPSTATSWAARACSHPSSHFSQWSRRISPSYMKVGNMIAWWDIFVLLYFWQLSIDRQSKAICVILYNLLALCCENVYFC